MYKYFQRKKPRRACYFCGKMQTSLHKHLFRKHKHEKVLQAAKTKREQTLITEKLRKMAIFDMNMDKQRKGEEITFTKTPTCKSNREAVVCGYCHGFFIRAQFWKHQLRCSLRDKTVRRPIKVSNIGITDRYPHLEPDFVSEVIERMASDTLAHQVKKDPLIMHFGRRNWAKSTKTDRASTSNAMRVIGSLTAKMGVVGSADLIKPENFSKLEKALTTYDDRPATKIKIEFWLKELSDCQKWRVLTKETTTTTVDEVDNFASLLKISSPFLFKEASRKVQTQQSKLSRMPKSLPVEKDVMKVSEYVNSELSRISQQSDDFQSESYTHLRNLVAAYITLYNCRRGGEGVRLTLEQYQEAKDGVWISHLDVESMKDPIDKYMMSRVILAYQEGKRRKSLVPLLVHKWLIPIIDRMLITRLEAGVNHTNEYVFANASDNNTMVRGWDAVNYVRKKIDIPSSSNINATCYRHRVSTYFGLLCLDGPEKKSFLSHMGHSEIMNAETYQSPPAFLEICRVGRFLESVELGQMNLNTTYKIQQLTGGYCGKYDIINILYQWLYGRSL